MVMRNSTAAMHVKIAGSVLYVLQACVRLFVSKNERKLKTHDSAVKGLCSRQCRPLYFKQHDTAGVAIKQDGLTA